MSIDALSWENICDYNLDNVQFQEIEYLVIS